MRVADRPARSYLGSVHRVHLLLVALFLAGCGTLSDGTGSDSSGSAQPTTSLVDRPAPPLRPVGEPSGTCPELGAGLRPMTSAGYDREVLLLTPPSPKPGLPVLFVWHGLGATARSMVPRLGLRELAAQGVIVVVPQAHPEADIGWGWTRAREDLVLFDDLRACLDRDLGVDLDRVVTSGFSAGGLWSTYLLFHRADSLATAVIMSGGLLPPILTYSTPAWSIPVVMFDGGPRDTYRAGPALIRFDRNTARLRDRLRQDGHLAVHCPNTGGHSVPTQRFDLIHRWALGHEYGAHSPWADREPPPGCT